MKTGLTSKQLVAFSHQLSKVGASLGFSHCNTYEVFNDGSSELIIGRENINLIHNNCRNCGANEFKENKCQYCKTKQ